MILPSLAALFFLLQSSAAAPSQPDLSPGTRYDPKVPTLQQAVGHDVGERISSPEEIAAYLKALHGADPARSRLVEYARSWEGRPLHVLIVGSAERLAKLDQVKADLRRLADPRQLPAADGDRLVRELPVVTWLLHSVHGDETTSSDAALAEAYHLLAARGSEAVDTILRESIVLIDPLQNPDGRARFLSHNLQAAAARPDPDPLAAEHDEPWPGGRSNHYLFDMNRDWLALSQPETRGRVALALEWFPHVVADLHEMGGDSTYYFAPPAEPANPYITAKQFEWLNVLGRENARRFDERGFAYFVREVFDSFYPGYGESWPIFHGAIGMTFEQASPSGLLFRRDDDTVLSYRQGIVQHFTAAITSAETAARNREQILRDFLEYRRSAVQEGERGPVREYLIPPGADRARHDRLAELLTLHGLEVRRAGEPVKAGSRTLPAGTLVLPLAQPASRLLRNVIEPTIQMDEKFLKEQERRRQKRLGDQIYDMTAWSLPLLFDLEIVTLPQPSGAKASVVTPRPATPGGPLPAAKVGYLLPWGSGTAAVVAEALQAGIRVRAAGDAFTQAGRKYPIGTAIVRISENGPDLASRLGPIVARHMAEAVPLETSWVEEGISLGSDRVVALKAPRVAMAWDVPTSSASAGWARYVLERRFGQPATAIRTAALRNADLTRYDVIVLPAGDYTQALGEDGVRRLKEWARMGGTIVTLGEASRWATREKVALLETTTELRGGKPDVEPAGDEKPKKVAAGEPAKPFDLQQAIQPDRDPPDAVPGAILRVSLDTEHWLSAGLDDEIQVVVEGRRIFTPIKLDKGRNVGLYAARDRLLAAGFAWDNPMEQLPQKAFLLHQPLGRGHVIAFAEDPNYRAFAGCTELLFMNAVLLGPAH
ncbi:MAG TPA: M14 family metallopeptidase [Vicinamibacterales bacterium]|nr:M14 family metallopeptidase [Vicinamibacterales bacterium]